jgi:TrmH family RNA methyltransferase
MKAPLFYSGPLFEADLPSTWALDSTGNSLQVTKLPKDLRILVGEEGPGLGNLRNVQRVRVPIQNVESLNATVAASLLMWEYRRQIT